MEGKRCAGVEFLRDDELVTARARREVIVAGGMLRRSDGGLTGEATVTRGATPMGLIGDAVFTSSGEDSGTLDFRMAAINNNRMGADAIEAAIIETVRRTGALQADKDVTLTAEVPGGRARADPAECR